jgi:hypothetical protein
MVVTLLAVISAYAALHGRPEVAVAIGVVLLLVVGLGIEGTGTAMSVALSELERMNRAPEGPAPERRRRRRVDPVALPRAVAAARARQCGRPVAAAADFDLERDGGRCRRREASLNEPLIGRHQNEEPPARSAVARSR